MIATIQIGNSDDKLTQQEWSRFVHALGAIFLYECKIHFFATSDGSKPWQNACWVLELGESRVEFLLEQLKYVREQYKQDSVAVVLGEVRMV